MSQRYILWVKFDGSRFSGFAKSGGCGFGVLDLIDGLLKHVMEPRGFTGIRCAAGSRTDTGVHVLRGPVAVNTETWKYRVDETPAIKSEIINEMNSVLKSVHHDSLEMLDMHRVSNGFSLRRNISYRKYVYRLRVAKNREIYENCKMLPSMPCFAERHHAWTLPPPFDIRKANEACQKFHGLNNMASFYKFPRRLQLEATYKDKITDRYINLAQVTRGCEISDIPDPNFDYYNFEVVSRSFLREQIRRMICVVVKCATGETTTKTIDTLFRNPHPDTFTYLKLKPAPPHGLFLVDCVYDPEMFMNPEPYCSHGWDNPYQNDERAEEEIASDSLRRIWA